MPSALTLLLAAAAVQLMLIVVLLTLWQQGRRSLHRHVQRRADLTARTGELVHELNQPLTAILSNAQAAQRFLAVEPLDVQELRDILSDIVMDNKRAAGIVKSLGGLVERETKVLEQS